MIFSYNWLKTYINGRVPKPEKLAELLTMHSFEVTEVYPVKSSKAGAKQFNRVKKVGKDFALDIDILPNRGPDCFSHLGVARECAVILNSKLKIPDSKIKEDKQNKVEDFVKIEVKNKMACPRYTARVVRDVKVAPSPKWLKERLKVCGLKPINNIVDIANFVMLETGQPFHAFDLEKLEGPKIIVRYGKKRERIVTLDEEKYSLDRNILIIADAKKPVAIAGIKGGIIPAVDKDTKTVVLESANFDPHIIRKGSKRLDLETDASWRFEHGLDPNLTEFAINRAAALIQKIAKGKVVQGLIDLYPKKVLPKRIELDLDYVERLLGVKIPLREIKNIFKRLGFFLYETRTRRIVVKVPTFRLDINIPEDLIEEIGRIYGFEKIKPVSPMASLIPPVKNLEIFWQNFIKDRLKEIGFTEVYKYSFIGQKEAEIFAFSNKNLIEVENPVSENQKYLRPSLIPNLLKNVKENIKDLSAIASGKEGEEIKIFELGKIFREDSSKTFLEKSVLTGLIFKTKKQDDIFYELKGVCDLLLEKMGIPNFWYDSYQPTPEESKISIWNIPNSAEIKINHQEIGFLGEISPKILEKLKIGRVVVFDFDFEKLQKLATEEHEFRPISKYPAALRDISVLVPEGVLVDEVLNEIEITGGSLVRDVDLFDIYKGEKIPKGKKNLSFHVIYQSDVKTLKSKEIDKIHQKIIKALEKRGWRVRKY